MKPLKRSLKALWVRLTVGTLSIVLLAAPAQSEVVPLEVLAITTIIDKEDKDNSREIAQAPVEPAAPVEQPPTPETLPEPTAAVEPNPTPETLPEPTAAVEPNPTSETQPEPAATVEPNLTPETEAVSALAPTEVKILAPTADSVVDIPAVAITLQYAIGGQVNLRVNGEAVDATLIGRTETDPVFKTITQTWYGVSLKEGVNTITAQASANGAVGELVSTTVQVAGAPVTISVDTVEARIPADGRSTATIQGQLIDKAGNRSNQDAIVTLEASAGEFVGVDFAPDQPGFQVQARQGAYTATLQSTLGAQTVRIRATSGKFEAFTQIPFETNLRPGIVTGVIDIRFGARGTDFHRSFRQFLPPDKDNRYQIDARGSVFATGRVLGDWLFTGAYNSDRTLNEGCNDTPRLFRDIQSCDRSYPVYGDTSKVEALTPSKDSVYLRLERSSTIPKAEPDFFMWGDYHTREFATRSQQFTATTRQLHGFKTNYNLGNLQITAFYGDNVQGFQRDTVAPDGTSGFYFLSRRLLIPGSENVSIETEELDRPGSVITRRQLNRTLDYEIDYDRGTLLFREPVLRTDVDPSGLVLVRRIVTTYQYESDSTSSIYGGRARYHLGRELNRESSLGVTYLQENQGIRNFELYGADAIISLGRNGDLIAEYAHSTNNSEVMGLMSGSAYRLEAQGELASGIQARAYFRSAETGFSNNATISFVPGQTRYGAQVVGRVSPTTSVRVQYDREDNQGIAPQPLTFLRDILEPRPAPIPGRQVDNTLTTISAGVQQRFGNTVLDVDFINRHREDRMVTSPLNVTSNQLRSRVSVPLSNTLTLRAQNELNLSNSQDLVYPDRTILSLDWAVHPGVNVRLNQIFFSGGQYENNSITSLDVDGKYSLGSDTTLIGRASVLNGNSLAGSIGLQQGWTIAKGLRLDFTYERIFGDFFNRTGAGVQFPQAFAPGQSASSIGVTSGDSYSLGFAYTNDPNFQAAARYEHRLSTSGSNTVISATATGKISPAITALFRYQQASSANQVLKALGDTAHLRVGVAYRDLNDDRFNALMRYEYRKNPAIIPETVFLGSGTGSEEQVLALEAIYAPNWRWEFYGKYAIRNSISYLAQDLVGDNTISLAQLRATYRLGYNMDVAGEVRWINQPNAGFSETGLVLEAGYYLTPNLRFSAGYAFGRVDDRDFNGTRSAGGVYFGLTVKLNELFDGFGLQKLLPPAPPEVIEEKSVPSEIPTVQDGNTTDNAIGTSSLETLSPTTLSP